MIIAANDSIRMFQLSHFDYEDAAPLRELVVSILLSNISDFELYDFSVNDAPWDPLPSETLKQSCLAKLTLGCSYGGTGRRDSFHKQKICRCWRS